MVRIGPIAHHISFGGLLGDQVGAVEVPIDETDGSVLRGNFPALVAVPDKGSDLVVWMRVRNGV
jgi:hypothetical protein